VNASPAIRSRKPAAGEKKSLVSKWDTKTWKLLSTRTVSQRPITAFDISNDGTLLAYGSSDLSVGVLDAKTLRVSPSLTPTPLTPSSVALTHARLNCSP